MQDLNDKVTGGTLTAPEWNEVPSEIQNVIEGLGIALSGADLNQLGKAIAGYAANGSFYTDSGAADTYVLSAIGLKQAPTAYTDGMQVSFRPANDSTGASTVNVAGLGVKNLKDADGNVVLSGEISTADVVSARYNSGAGEFRLTRQLTAAKEADLKSGRKNKLIGNFFINQRAVSGSVVLASGEYGHDRFKAGSGGCTYTFAVSNGVTTLTISAGTLEQVIEAENIEAGDYILSWGGTAQGQIDAGGFGDSGLVTDTLNGSADVIVEFDTGTLLLPQLELGTNVTAYERRSISEEIVLCQRYYWETSNAMIVPRYNDSTTIRQVNVPNPVRMRASPSITVSSSAGTPSTPSAGVDFSRISVSGASASAGITITNYEADAEL